MRRLTLLTLVLLLLLRPCNWTVAQSNSSDTLALSLDTLAPSPEPLSVLLPGALFAAYPLHHSDVAIRTTRHSLLGTRWRNHYDDHMQFASYGLQLAMRCGGATGRSRTWGEMLTADAIGALGTATIVLSVKSGVQRMRPDGSTANSFPSGHTATAFLGAELFNLEYGADYPLLSHLQYLFATSVAFGRMANNRHWYSDVLWGGLIGVSMAHVGYLMSDLIFGRYTPAVGREIPDDYFYLSLLCSRHLSGGAGCVGAQLGWQTASLNYAAELSLRPDKEHPTLHGDLLVGVPLYQWRYLELRHNYGLGIGYDKAAGEQSYAHLQAGLEAYPRLRYLDKLGLFLRLHCEPYRQSYLTLGVSLRHRYL